MKSKQHLDNFVTIMTFTYPMELAVLRGRLEADGIECRVLDELTVQVNPFYSNAIGGVKLQVRESDIQKAIGILIEGGYIKNEDLQPPKGQTKPDRATLTSKEVNIKCPNCGSGEVSKNKFSEKAFAISVLLLGFPLPFINKTYRCFDCGQNFKKLMNSRTENIK
jgi:DNA-directed RNA polymerase subunit RPC12/RpoP